MIGKNIFYSEVAQGFRKNPTPKPKKNCNPCAVLFLNSGRNDVC